MGGRYSKGFTVLETMLFLAITGALVVGILVGVTASINTQRYRDSVVSLKTVLQDQYSELGNVYNGRSGSWKCESSATTVEVTDGTSQLRGQSDCVILGRYITISNSDITMATVTGYAPLGARSSGTDIEILQADYTLGISDVDITTSQLEWGTRIAWPVSGPNQRPAGTPRSIAILLVRSPTSGITYTFTSDNVPPIESVNNTTLEAMLVEGPGIPGQGGRRLCVESAGLAPNAQQAIFINSFTTNASGIETRSNEMGDADAC
jgi:type II secretory pathway pseudopilin PulG